MAKSNRANDLCKHSQGGGIRKCVCVCAREGEGERIVGNGNDDEEDANDDRQMKKICSSLRR